MGIAELILAIAGLIGKVIPPLRRSLEQRNGGYAVWKPEITYWDMPPRSVGGRFFGRDAELKAISNAFKRGQNVALSGMTGVGKSQLAAEFVKKSKRKGFWTQGAGFRLRP